ncbi:hypothetical protein AVEN_231402-1 [Araneus ventricosus]|uniref:Uncharacterized protein n=1 Tax=Araneus ventricosus TaxID=182803 RepID=A0A4Y2LK75_ARAVE|nr:hypothetical protein AVEN_231402-1 [Araneus ventricosus]
MELETSRITNEIRADPLTIPEEGIGFRGHCPVDWYTNKFTALVPPKKRESKKLGVQIFKPLRNAYLEEEKNCGLTERQAEEHEKEFSRNEAVRFDSGFVEEKVSGAAGLSPHRVSVSVVGHVVELRKGSSGNAAMLETGVNFGDLCSIERTGVMRIPVRSGCSQKLFCLWVGEQFSELFCCILMRGGEMRYGIFQRTVR